MTDLVFIRPKSAAVLYAFAFDYFNHLRDRLFWRDDALDFPG